MKNLLIALSLILSTSAVLASDSVKLKCTGTEPDWNISVDGQTVVYKSPTNLKGTTYLNAYNTEAAGMVAGNGFQVNASTKRNIQKITLSVIKAGSEGCSDGMSEDPYTHSVLVNVGGKLLLGCCNIL